MAEETKKTLYYWMVYILGKSHDGTRIKTLSFRIISPSADLPPDKDMLELLNDGKMTYEISTVWSCGTTEFSKLKSTDGGKEHKWRVWVDVFDNRGKSFGMSIFVTGHDQLPGTNNFHSMVSKEACGELPLYAVHIKSWLRLT